MTEWWKIIYSFFFDSHLCTAKFTLQTKLLHFFYLNDQAFEPGKKNVCNHVLSYDFWRLEKNLDDLSSFQQSSAFRNSKKILSNVYVAEKSQSLNLIYSLLESGEGSAWGYTTIPTIEFAQDFYFRFDIQTTTWPLIKMDVNQYRS